MKASHSEHIEEWRPIPCFESRYSVSDQGRVRSEARLVKRERQRYGRKERDDFLGIPERVLKPGKRASGHLHVSLWEANKQHTWQIADLVMLAFVGPKPEGMVVLHSVNGPQDNRLISLRYGTQSQNITEIWDHRGYSRGTSKFLGLVGPRGRNAGLLS